MILDKIENAAIYAATHAGIQQVLFYINTTDLNSLTSGKHNIDGDNIFLLVNQYDTKDEEDCYLEAHRKYIDFQYLIKGKEIIGYSLLNNHLVTREYDPANDYELFQPKDLSFLKVSSGSFVIFFSEDLHMPGIKYNEKETVKKLVFKIKID